MTAPGGLGTLCFRPRRPSAAVAAAMLPDGVRLTGEHTWRVSGTAPEIAALADALGPALAERVGDAHLLIAASNAVGVFAVRDLGRLEIVCGKWDEAAFTAMLLEVVAAASELAFDARAPGGVATERTLGTPTEVLLHRFLYLRQIVAARTHAAGLVPAFLAVLRDPHRLLIQERRLLPPERARGVDARTVRAIAMGVSAQTRTVLPERVDVPWTRDTADTAENRALRGFLFEIDALLRAVGALVGRVDESLGIRLTADLVEIERHLAPIRRAGLWRDIGPPRPLAGDSQVWLRRRGYREIHRHALALRALARPLVDAETLDALLGLKDVARLYELWVYFQVVQACAAALGAPPARLTGPEASFETLRLRWGARAVWSTGAEVLYNAEFSPQRPVGHRYRSRSLHLRPDVVVVVPGADGATLHVLDAKLRLDAEGASKADDLQKMHVYLDALPAVATAFVLFPGEDSTCLDPDGRADLGAIPLRPGGPTAALVAHLAQVLRP